MKYQDTDIGVKRASEETVDALACSCCEDGKLACTKRLCAESSFINEDGQTRLHLLCQDRSCTVDDVSDTISAYPEALQRRDVYGRPPLLYALKRACTIGVVKVLFDCYPEAILLNDFCGDSPLYLLYHSSKDHRILEYVLRQMPSLAMHRENSFSGQPLVKRICAPWASNELALTRAEVETNEILKDRWTKLVLTVRAAHVHTTEQNGTSMAKVPELHLALEFACPPKVLSHFAEMYPEQASLPMGEDGCYPLHYFLSRYDASQDAKASIQRLLHAFPEAVNCRYGGKLPLHVSLNSGWSWEHGTRDIAYASSRNLDCQDPEAGLVPFLQAASLELSDLSTVYCLLRENPAAIANL